MRCEKALQASKLAKLPCCRVSRRHRRHCAPSGKRGNHVAAVRGIILHDDASFPKVVLVLQVGTRRRTTHNHHKDDGLKRERENEGKRSNPHTTNRREDTFSRSSIQHPFSPPPRTNTFKNDTPQIILNTTWFCELKHKSVEETSTEKNKYF